MALVQTDILQALNDAGVTKAELTKLFRYLRKQIYLERQSTLSNKLMLNGSLTDSEQAELTANEATLASLITQP